jgi:hypothetical protein
MISRSSKRAMRIKIPRKARGLSQVFWAAASKHSNVVVDTQCCKLVIGEFVSMGMVLTD